MSAICTTLPSSGTRAATESRPGTIASLAHGRPILVVEGVVRHIAKDLAFAHRDPSGIAAAKPRGGSGDRVEHRLNIEAGPADDLEHVAGRGLVFERFLQIVGAGLQFAKQPRILRMAPVEPPLQLRVGAPKIGGIVVEDHGHLLTPLRAGPSRMLFLILRSPRRRPAARARVDGRTWPETRMCGIIPLAGAASPSRSADPISDEIPSTFERLAEPNSWLLSSSLTSRLLRLSAPDKKQKVQVRRSPGESRGPPFQRSAAGSVDPGFRRESALVGVSSRAGRPPGR